MVNLSQSYETLQSSRQIAGTTGSETSDTHECLHGGDRGGKHDLSRWPIKCRDLCCGLVLLIYVEPVYARTYNATFHFNLH